MHDDELTVLVREGKGKEIHQPVAAAVWQRRAGRRGAYVARECQRSNGLSWAEMRTNVTSRHGILSWNRSRARQLGRRASPRSPCGRARCMSSLPSRSSDSLAESVHESRRIPTSQASISLRVGVNRVGRQHCTDVQPWTSAPFAFSCQGGVEGTAVFWCARSRRAVWQLALDGPGCLALPGCSAITSSTSRVAGDRDGVQ